MEEFKTSFNFDAKDNLPKPPNPRPKINKKALGIFLIVGPIIALPSIIAIYGLSGFFVWALPYVAVQLFNVASALILLLSLIGIVVGIPVGIILLIKRDR